MSFGDYIDHVSETSFGDYVDHVSEISFDESIDHISETSFDESIDHSSETSFCDSDVTNYDFEDEDPPVTSTVTFKCISTRHDMHAQNILSKVSRLI